MGEVPHQVVGAERQDPGDDHGDGEEAGAHHHQRAEPGAQQNGAGDAPGGHPEGAGHPAPRERREGVPVAGHPADLQGAQRVPAHPRGKHLADEESLEVPGGERSPPQRVTGAR